MSTTYTLGHEDSEVHRLLLQGRVYRADTRHALLMAGLKPGMRVLDIGSGPGDVSFLATEIAGPDDMLPLLQREMSAAKASIMIPPQITAWVQVR